MKTPREEEAPRAHEPTAFREAWAQFDEPAAASRGWGRRGWMGLAAGLALAVAAAWHFVKPGPAAPRHESVLVVSVPSPPPPPPPVAPPPPERPPEQRMIEQTPVENEAKPEPPKDEPPPVNLSSNLSSNGPADAFGLSGRGGGTGAGGGGSDAPARSRWGWYAAQVQSRLEEALRGNRATHTASLRVVVKIWADSAGRVTRAALAESTGSTALDGVLREQVLTGLTLNSAPPAGMPMPIVLRLTARRP